LIHSSSYDSAYEVWIDESEPIDPSEVVEAYGIDDTPEMQAWRDNHPPPNYYFNGPEGQAWLDAKQAEAKRILSQWVSDASDGLRDYPKLQEGYVWQSNSSGTGIVATGHYSWLNPADLTKITIQRKEKEKV
jgi:hypothetical protein